MNFYRLLKHLSNKEGQKRLDSDKKPTTDGIKFTWNIMEYQKIC